MRCVIKNIKKLGVFTVAQWVNNLACLCDGKGLIPCLVHQVKDPELLQLWHRPQLWLGFDPWSREFPYVVDETKKEKKKKSSS